MLCNGSWPSELWYIPVCVTLRVCVLFSIHTSPRAQAIAAGLFEHGWMKATLFPLVWHSRMLFAIPFCRSCLANGDLQESLRVTYECKNLDKGTHGILEHAWYPYSAWHLGTWLNKGQYDETWSDNADCTPTILSQQLGKGVIESDWPRE
jgi:hypothetical protein